MPTAFRITRSRNKFFWVQQIHLGMMKSKQNEKIEVRFPIFFPVLFHENVWGRDAKQIITRFAL